MKTVVTALLSFCLFVAGDLAQAQIGDANAAINKAGRQRMLSQRLAKAYLQVGQQVETDRSKKVLDVSLATFDRQLAEIKAYAPTPEIKATYQKLDATWQTYRSLLRAAPSKENAPKVLELSEQVLGLAQQGTEQFEKQSGTAAGHLVNLAGRERMLSQRLAKMYQANAWGLSDPNAAAGMEKTRKAFADGLKELTAAPGNTQQIKEALDLVKQQWFFFENALSQPVNADKRPQTAVATTSERILEEMENVVTLYEAQSR